MTDILAGWGKNLGKMQFGKIKPFLGKNCATYERFMGINYPYLVGWSTQF